MNLKKKALITICAICVAVAGYYKGRVFFETNRIFYLLEKDIDIKGNNYLSQSDIMFFLKLQSFPVNAFDLDVENMERALSGHPWIKKCKISRRFPRRLSVMVEERKPIAFLSIDNDPLRILSSDCALMPYNYKKRLIGLPMIYGLYYKDEDSIDMTRKINFIRDISDIFDIQNGKMPDFFILESDIRNINHIILLLKYRGGKVKILLTPENVRLKLRQAAMVLRKLKIKSTDINYIDARIENHIYVNFGQNI